MIEELETAGLLSPKFLSDSARFQLVFYKELDESTLKTLGFSSRQLAAIDYVKKHGSISNTEYQAIANVSKPTATRDLKLLKEKGILTSEGVTGRGTLYKLKGSKGSQRA